MGPADATLAVLWEDPHGLAVAKPAGLLTQRSGRPGSEDSLEDRVRRYLSPADPSACYLGTVHRLDRPVSGVVLWAKTPKAARRWAEQFAGRLAVKEYWAIVGRRDEASPPLPRSGTWRDRIGRPDASGRAPIFGADAEGPGSSPASTRFEVVDDLHVPEGVARLRLWPESGRTHQLRAQASHRGWPIVGDSAYGSARGFPRGIALHARSLVVEHPASRAPLRFEAGLPPSWSGWGG